MRFCNYTKIKFGIYFTWQWGWGLEQPIAAPLFSKIWTHLEDTIGNWNTICVCLYVRSLFDCYKQVFTTQARLNMIRPNLIENICRRRRRPPTCTSANKKNLLVLLAQGGHLRHPGVDDRLDLRLAHQGQGHVGLGAETHHPACPSCCGRPERVVFLLLPLDLGLLLLLRRKNKYTWKEGRQYLLAQEHPQAVRGSHCWKQMLTHT